MSQHSRLRHRNAAIVQTVLDGNNLQETGRIFHLTRESIRQTLRKSGVAYPEILKSRRAARHLRDLNSTSTNSSVTKIHALRGGREILKSSLDRQQAQMRERLAGKAEPEKKPRPKVKNGKEQREKERRELFKRAFDQTALAVIHVRCIIEIGGLHGTNYEQGKQRGWHIPATSIEFWVDVQAACADTVPDVDFSLLDAAYFSFDSSDELEREIHAQEVIPGVSRHRIERSLGRIFMQRGLTPDKYFRKVRRAMVGFQQRGPNV